MPKHGYLAPSPLSRARVRNKVSKLVQRDITLVDVDFDVMDTIKRSK
jgi:hypothetical protein